jgi:hypothetical protein
METKNITAQIAEVAKNYDYKEPPSFLVMFQDWIAYVLRTISDFLGSFKIIIPGLSDVSTVSSIMQFLLYLAGIAAAGAVMYLVWNRLGYLNTQTQLARGGKAITQSLLDSAGWRNEAGELATKAEWRDACRAIYLSLLRLLSEKHIAEFAPTRTNYEYFYMLASHPRLQHGFREVASRVESIWFGGADASESDYQYCLAKVDELSGEVEKP